MGAIRKDKLAETVIDYVDHFAAQTIPKVVEVLGNTLAPLGVTPAAIEQTITDLCVQGSLEVNEKGHLSMASDLQPISKVAVAAVKEVAQAKKEIERNLPPASSTKVRWFEKLLNAQNGFIEVNGKKVRLDPYSNKPAPSDRAQDGSVYFANQKHNLRRYARYVQQVGIADAVHPYEWMCAAWFGQPLTNDNPKLAKSRREKARLSRVEPQHLFGDYWRDVPEET